MMPERVMCSPSDRREIAFMAVLAKTSWPFLSRIATPTANASSAGMTIEASRFRLRGRRKTAPDVVFLSACVLVYRKIGELHVPR